MNLLPAVEFFSLILLDVVIAEQKYGPGAGEEKLDFALGQVKGWLEKPRSPAWSDIADIEEILKTVTAAINAIVRLLNLLGIFQSSRAPAAKKDPE